MKLRYFLLMFGVAGAILGLMISPPNWFPESLRLTRTSSKKNAKPSAKPKPKPKPVEPSVLDEDAAITDVENTEQPAEPEQAVEEQPIAAEEELEDFVRYKGKGEADGKTPVHEAAYHGKLLSAVWRQPERLARSLASKLKAKLKKDDQDSVIELLKDPENRLMVAQWELIRRSDIKALSALMKNQDACKVLTPLLNDLQWISSFVYDTGLENAAVALDMVYHFRKMDPEMDQEVLLDGKLDTRNAASAAGSLKRRVASAIAAQFARNGWYGDEKPLSAEELREMKQNGMVVSVGGKKSKTDTYAAAKDRYRFFSESIDQGALNCDFAKMPDWLMQFPCGWKGNNPFGTIGSMRWLRDNCAAPAKAYTGMAYQVEYLPTNVFGDSIFTDYYYQPFEFLNPGNHAKTVRDTGGVCGSLSHFGASSACANGVPAITMGEPGHCAYAVYLDGKWNPCNSISEKHSPHWKTWDDYTWGSLQMQTAMYQSGQLTRDAQMVASLGEMLVSLKQVKSGLKLFELSATMQPLNSEVWTRYMASAAAGLNRNVKRWQQVNEFVCSAITPCYPGRCASLLQKEIYPAMFAAMKLPKQKLEAFQTYFSNWKDEEEGEWELEKLLDLQYAEMGRGQSQKLDYFKLVVDSASQKTDFAAAITWALVTSNQENKSLGRKVQEMVDAAEAASPHPELVAAAEIRAAELLGDCELSRRFAQKYPYEGTVSMPDFTKPAGNLVSDKAKIVLSKYPREMATMLGHSAALTEQGGTIKSDAGKHQTITVELEKPVVLGSLVIVPNTNGKDYRMWNLEVSLDGKEWKTQMSLPDAADKPFFNISFDRNAPRVKYIRIDSGENQEIGINFKALLIYDNKKS